MALNAQGYFNHLRTYFADDYVVDWGDADALSITDKYYPDGDSKQSVRKIVFPFIGEAFAVNLDMTVNTKENGKKSKSEFSPPLYRFLDDNGKPWSKRCDYVIFHRLPLGLYVYCIELKSNYIDAEKISAQLASASCWVRSLKSVIENYTGHSLEIKVQKFVFSTNNKPAAHLSPDGKYLARDPSIRFYHYDDLDEMSLADLENISLETI